MNKTRKTPVHSLDETEQILSFLQRAFPTKTGTRKLGKSASLGLPKMPPAMLSAKSRQVIKELYRKIRNIGIFHYQMETAEPSQMKPLDSYIPKEIHDVYDHYPKICRRTQISVRGRTVYIECVFPLSGENQIFENPEKADAFFQDAVYKIYLWLSVASMYAPVHCSSALHVHLYMTLAKKGLPAHSETHIGVAHANTAFTTSCAPTTEINVFRKEEWFKVFLHETFHSLGMDFSEMDSTDANARICAIFRVKSNVRLYETYCEMWAEMVQILFYLFLEKNTPVSKVSGAFLNCIRNEKMFSVFQCVKVLRFFGLKYKDLFEEERSMAKYKESTQVLSYYVLKSVAMVFVNDFIEWCISHNPNVLDFTKTKENVSEYCDFFETYAHLPKYIEYIHLAETSLTHEKALTPFLKNTMRMSVYG